MSAPATPRIASYADDDIVIGEGVALSIPAAGWVLRAGSAAIDAAIVFIGYLVSLLALGWVLTSFVLNNNMQFETAWVPVIQITWAVLWFLLVPLTIETLSNGRSLGKLIFGLRVVRDDGGAIGFRHSFVRAIAGLAEIFGTMGSIAALVGLFNPRSKRVGDLLAGTYAQYERAPKPKPLGLTLPPQLAAWANLADVARLPDPLARRIRDFFTQAHALSPNAREHLVHPIPDVDATTFLVGVTVVRRDREYAGMLGRQRRTARLDATLHGNPHGFPTRG
jgi:uncharacterized RDD family membrane protein YckC